MSETGIPDYDKALAILDQLPTAVSIRIKNGYTARLLAERTKSYALGKSAGYEEGYRDGYALGVLDGGKVE